MAAENPSPVLLTGIRAENFRCFSSVEATLDQRVTIFTGNNGAGKTSLLEAIYFLGRGRSFRNHDSDVLIRAGAEAAEIGGQVVGSNPASRLRVRVSRAAVDFRINGMPALASDFVALFPVQALHTEIGQFIHGAPELRRRLLDWGVFHVEHDYLAPWRHYRRALSQRNAALRVGSGPEVVRAWDTELATAGEQVNRHRIAYLGAMEPEFQRLGAKLLGMQVAMEFRPGWNPSSNLRDALESQLDSDRAAGHTRAGPHRADLQITIQDEKSRWRASKGQQKLLAAAFILAQSSLVSGHLRRPVALVVDEPAADLDSEHLARYLQAIESCRAQIFMAAITADGLGLTGRAAMFHVEHDGAKALL